MRDGKLFEIEVNPARLLLGGIEVDGNENSIVTARFAVAEDIGIVDRMEGERTIAVEGGIVAADSVDKGDQRGEAVARGAVPLTDFVLFTVEILFAPRLCGSAFAELKGGPIDAVIGPERRGENEALHKSWPCAGLERCMKNVGSVGPKVGVEEVRHWLLRDLLKILLQFVFRVAPGEVRVGLGKSGLRQRVHDVRASKGLCEKDYVGIFFVNLGDAPLPERQCLGVWVIDAEDTDIVANPIGEDIA